MAGRKSFLLRIDAGLWAEVEGLAAAELRSTNGQVEYLLREALRRRTGDIAAPLAAPTSQLQTPAAEELE